MKSMAVVVPTRGTTPYLSQTLESIAEAAAAWIEADASRSVRVAVVVNGTQDAPIVAIPAKLQAVADCVNLLSSKSAGKVRAIHAGLVSFGNQAIDLITTVDDDVLFGKQVLVDATQALANDDLSLIGFRTAPHPYPGSWSVRRLLHDIINCRALFDLYKGGDPFLVGRLVVIRGHEYPVPVDRVVDDIALATHYLDRLTILPGPVRYRGVASFSQHARRVIWLEAARRQGRRLDGDSYAAMERNGRRQLEVQKLVRSGPYVWFCLGAYRLLRVFTNGVISRVRSHEGVAW